MAYSDVYTGGYSDLYGSVARSDVYADRYGPVYGEPYPQVPLDVRLAIFLGASWTDITRYAYQRDTNAGITITRGRPDESSGCNPGVYSGQLNNRGGNFTVRNPSGAWYGLLGRNTPLRCSVPALEPFLRIEDDTASGAFCPDANPLDITGQIDVRLDVKLSSYQPCVLASKWLGLVTTPTTTPPPVPGASVPAQSVKGAATLAAAAATFDGWFGGTRTPALNAQRIYNPSGFPTSLSADQLALLAAKCQFVVSWQPALDGSDWASLSPSIAAFANAAAAAGAPAPMLLLWHEPNNSKHNLTASQFTKMMQTYYPLVKAAYPALQLGYCALGTGKGVVASYYPGDAYCDFLMQDLYGNMNIFGNSNLSTLVGIATSASPPKPVGFGEIGETTNVAKRLSTAQFTKFMNYVTSVPVNLAANGFPCAPAMWFQDTLGGVNTITGPSDSRLPALKSWYDALASATGGGGSSGAQRSWALVLNGDGTLGFWWTSDGTLNTVQKVKSALPLPLGRVTARVRVTISHGVATVTFYTAPGGCADSLDGTGGQAPWTQLGPPVTGLTVSIFSGSASLSVGYNTALTSDYPAYGGPPGNFYEFEVRSFQGQYSDTYADLYGAPTGGLTVAHAQFSGQSEGTTGWTDPQGNPWSVTGTAEISQRSYRGHFELSNLPTTWDVTGTDVWSPVQGGGLLRRLSQGSQPPVSSAFKRAVLGLTGALAPVAYWPCEDASNATRIGPAIGPAAITFGVPPQLASDSSFACSNAIPVIGPAVMQGPIQPYTGGTAVVARFLMHVAAGSVITDGSVICRVNTTGSVGDFTLRYKSGGQLQLTGYGGGAFLFDTGALSQFSVIGAELLVSMELTVSGGQLKYAISTLAVGATTPVTVSGTVSGVPGNAALIHFSAPGQSLAGLAVGQVFVQSAYEPLTDFAAALAAHAGETAAQRFARLCTENGIQPRIYGYPDTDVPMGAQAPDTLTNLLALCEATGRGLVYEPRQCLGLGYRTVGSLCQQKPALAAGYAAGHVGEDSSTLLQPTTDDQHTVNDVTVSNSGGSSFEAVLADGSAMSVSPPPAGVGDYGNSYTVNTAADSQLASIAWWINHVGTSPEDRYPAIPFNLTRAAVANLFFALLTADVGDYFEITGTPGFTAPAPVKQLLYGTTETLGGFRLSLAWNAVPEAPYETGIYADPVFGRMDTDGSQLDSGVPAGPVADGYGDLYADTYGASVAWLYVDTTGPSGLLWTTNPADFPFDVLVSGEQVTVLAITGASSPQLFTVTRAVNGVQVAHSQGDAVALAHPAIIGLA